MNSDKRMAELYLERAAGKKHLYLAPSKEWTNKESCEMFFPGTEYKLKPETLDEVIQNFINHNGPEYPSIIYIAMQCAAKWAWANPESKE